MSGKGTILRLIDVVLIILVGFVSIADLAEKSRIRFPYTQQEAQEAETEERAVISIIVRASETNVYQESRERLDEDGRFREYPVQLHAPEYLINWRQGEIEESRQAMGRDELKRQLQDLIRLYGRATIEAVNVVPTETSPVSGTVAIYDIASQLNLPFPGVDLSGSSGAIEFETAGGDS